MAAAAVALFRVSCGSTVADQQRKQQRRELKDALAARLATSKGSLDESAMALVSSLEPLSPVSDLRDSGGMYKGAFVGLRASFKNTGRKGEALKDVGYSGAIVTLGRASFNVFKPSSLEIKLLETYNHVGCSFGDEYSLIINFQIASSGLEGFLINRARYTIVGAKRMDVVFFSSTMKPKHPDKDLEDWLKVFKDESQVIDEVSGAVEAKLPAAKGWLDYLYLDDELRITRGNRGGVSVVQRLDEPIIAI